MNKRQPIFILVVVFLILTITCSVAQTTGVKTTISDVDVLEVSQSIQIDPSTLEKAAVQARVADTFGQLPLLFEENQGQWDEQVSYVVQGSDKTLYFTPEGITIALTSRPEEEDESNNFNNGKEPGTLGTETGKPVHTKRWVIKLDFLGANSDVQPIGENRDEAVFSYFKGQPEQWHTGIPTYRRLVYHDLWPGIDLVYDGTVNRLKYHFTVQPGADPTQIRLAYSGASDVSVNPAGQLVIATPQGSIQDEAPIAYQNVNGKQVPVTISYALENPETAVWTYGFELGDYDPSLPLVLDPAVLVYAGYIAGSNGSLGLDVVVDGSGNAYVIGLTTSSEASFPITVGPDLTYNGGGDAFVAKVNSTGTGLVYAGYIGGSNADDAIAIDIDGSGNAYVTGSTNSTQATFPVIVGPDLTHNGGVGDAFVAKINAAGTSLVYAGYIGGSSSDAGWGIAVDGSGNAYITGETGSNETTFPVSVGPDLTHNGGPDAFVTKVNQAGTGLIYSGYIGGSDIETGFDIDIDGSGNAYVIGETYSTEATFPVIIGPDLSFNGLADAFAAKINPTGTGLVYAGYIGGNDNDSGWGIAVDGLGNAFITGLTYSTEATFPVTVGPDLTYNGGLDDAFVVKINQTGADLIYAGYIGGSGGEEGHDIAVDGSGNAYVTGETNSSEATFPITVGPDLTYNGGVEDAYVVKINQTGTGLSYAGYIGGSGVDEAWGIAVDSSGDAYITGDTSSTEATFPVTIGPDLTFNSNSYDAFVAKISANEIQSPTNLSLEGPSLGLVNSTQTFTATVYPITATQPITYVWQASDQLPITNTGGLTNVVSYSWAMTGTKHITVTASNAVGTISGTHAITLELPLSADFTASPLSGFAPLNVTFLNTSSGDYDSCLWDFGDGNNSSNCDDPIHTFSAPGSYTVSLTISGSGGSDVHTIPNYINVDEYQIFLPTVIANSQLPSD